MAEGRRITAADLELAEDSLTRPMISIREARNEAERRILLDALKQYRGNITRAAKAVQISRPAFHELLAKHGIRAEECKGGSKL
jgi:two-component system NtrC family response regulator